MWHIGPLPSHPPTLHCLNYLGVLAWWLTVRIKIQFQCGWERNIEDVATHFWQDLAMLAGSWQLCNRKFPLTTLSQHSKVAHEVFFSCQLSSSSIYCSLIAMTFIFEYLEHVSCELVLVQVSQNLLAFFKGLHVLFFFHFRTPNKLFLDRVTGRLSGADVELDLSFSLEWIVVVLCVPSRLLGSPYLVIWTGQNSSV